MNRIDPRIQRAAALLFAEKPWLSARTVAELVGCAPGTAHGIRLALPAANFKSQEIETLSDVALAERLQGRPDAPGPGIDPDWEAVDAQLSQPDATLHEIWVDWCEGQAKHWSYGHFTRRYRRWKRKQDLSMRRVHRAGEKSFVDFAGGRLEINLPMGTVREAQLFVGVLGASNYTFARLVWTQGIDDWIECHNRMVEFFGGATEFFVPDNLKAAVTRPGLKQLILNPTYQTWARHHGALIFPARVRKPKHKAKAEVAVQIVQRVVLWRMRKRTWHSLEEANAALEDLLVQLNERPFRKMKGCRRERFKQIDQPALKPLPAQRFEYFELVCNLRVPSNYHVEFDDHFYSVPYSLVSRKVDLRVTTRMIEVLHGGRRVCAHERSMARDELATTFEEHMPDAHRHAHHGEPAELRAWAARVGPATRRLVESWLAPTRGFYRGLLAARGLRQDADVYDLKRIESACRYAERVGVRALSRIRSILRNGYDQRASDRPQGKVPVLHEHLRGASYFGCSEEEAA